jgi:hypothetical protein
LEKISENPLRFDIWKANFSYPGSHGKEEMKLRIRRFLEITVNEIT